MRAALALFALALALAPAAARAQGHGITAGALPARGVPQPTDIIPCAPVGQNLQGCAAASLAGVGSSLSLWTYMSAACIADAQARAETCDDTAAVQAWVAAAIAQKRDGYAPAGAYKIASAQLVIDMASVPSNGLTFFGDNTATTIFDFQASTANPPFIYHVSGGTTLSPAGETYGSILGIGIQCNVAGPCLQIGNADFSDAINQGRFNLSIQNFNTGASSTCAQWNEVLSGIVYANCSTGAGPTGGNDAWQMEQVQFTNFTLGGSNAGNWLHITNGFTVGNVFTASDCELVGNCLKIDSANAVNNTWIGGTTAYASTGHGVVETAGANNHWFSPSINAIPANFISAGSGAYFEKWDRSSLPISVVTFGADATGATDSTSAFNAAGAAGANVSVPPGTYLLNGTVTLSQAGAHLQFAGQGATTINVGSATGDAFVLSGVHATVSGGVSFTHALTRTSGADIHCEAEYCQVGPIYDNAPYWAVELDGNATLAYVDHPSCRNIVPDVTATGSACIRVGVTGSNESSIINSPFCDIDATASSTTVPTTCILDDWSDALQILDPNLIHGKYGVWLSAPSGHSILATQFMDGGFLDTPFNYSLALTTTGTGNIIHTTLDGTALSDAGVLGQTASGGLFLSQSGSGTLEGVTCTGCDLFIDGSAGIALSGYIYDLAFNGGCISQVTDGIAAPSGVVLTGLTLNGARIGTCNAFTGVTTGVHLYSGSTTSGLIAADDNFTGTTTPFSGLAAGLTSANNKIRDNIGYNPVGGSTPTVGASPWTYQNGPSPAMLCANSGTVSAIATGGVAPLYNAGGSCYPLGPNQSIQFTFTVAPNVEVVTQ